jgi:hypothetical protein
MTDITTVTEFRKAVRKAREVLAQVRFGTSERWVRISKADALTLVAGMARDTTPEDAELYSGIFGTFDGATLHVG